MDNMEKSQKNIRRNKNNEEKIEKSNNFIEINSESFSFFLNLEKLINDLLKTIDKKINLRVCIKNNKLEIAKIKINSEKELLFNYFLNKLKEFISEERWIISVKIVKKKKNYHSKNFSVSFEVIYLNPIGLEESCREKLGQLINFLNKLEFETRKNGKKWFFSLVYKNN